MGGKEERNNASTAWGMQESYSLERFFIQDFADCLKIICCLYFLITFLERNPFKQVRLECVAVPVTSSDFRGLLNVPALNR